MAKNFMRLVRMMLMDLYRMRMLTLKYLHSFPIWKFCTSKQNASSEFRHRELLNRVTTLKAEQKGLYEIQKSLSVIFDTKSLRDLFERCFASTSGIDEAEKYQHLTESAARSGISTKEVKRSLFCFVLKKCYLLAELDNELNRHSRLLKANKVRKVKKGMKILFSIFSETFLHLQDIVDECWLYFNTEQKQFFKQLAAMLVEVDFNYKIQQLLDKKKHTASLSSFNKSYLNFCLNTQNFVNTVSRVDRCSTTRTLNNPVVEIADVLLDFSPKEFHSDETEYLFNTSAKNAQRLNTAIQRAKLGVVKPKTLEQLYQDLNIEG